MGKYERNRKRKGATQIRMIYYVTMGLLYICFGVFLLLAEDLGFVFQIDISQTFIWTLSIILFLYGGFRIYRGLKHIF